MRYGFMRYAFPSALAVRGRVRVEPSGARLVRHMPQS